MAQTDTLPAIRVTKGNPLTINLQPSKTESSHTVTQNPIGSEVDNILFTYTGSPEPTTSLSTTGTAAINGNGPWVLKFTKDNVGLNTFTITAENVVGKATATFTVNVIWNGPKGAVVPGLPSTPGGTTPGVGGPGGGAPGGPAGVGTGANGNGGVGGLPSGTGGQGNAGNGGAGTPGTGAIPSGGGGNERTNVRQIYREGLSPLTDPRIGSRPTQPPLGQAERVSLRPRPNGNGGTNNVAGGGTNNVGGGGLLTGIRRVKAIVPAVPRKVERVNLRAAMRLNGAAANGGAAAAAGNGAGNNGAAGGNGAPPAIVAPPPGG